MSPARHRANTLLLVVIFLIVVGLVGRTFRNYSTASSYEPHAITITLPDSTTCSKVAASDVREVRIEIASQQHLDELKTSRLARKLPFVSSANYNQPWDYPLLAMPRFEGRPKGAIFRKEQDGVIYMTSILMNKGDSQNMLKLWESCNYPYGVTLEQGKAYHIFLKLMNGTSSFGFYVYFAPDNNVYFMG